MCFFCGGPDNKKTPGYLDRIPKIQVKHSETMNIYQHQVDTHPHPRSLLAASISGGFQPIHFEIIENTSFSLLTEAAKVTDTVLEVLPGGSEKNWKHLVFIWVCP